VLQTPIAHTPATVIKIIKHAPQCLTIEPAILSKITLRGTHASKTWDVWTGNVFHTFLESQVSLALSGLTVRPTRVIRLHLSAIIQLP